jgi:hypothetical protein
MSKISETTLSSLSTFRSKMGESIEGCAYLEEAAQKFTDAIYEEFKDSIVLVRLFAAIPFGDLPASNQAFVTDLAASAGISHLVEDQTLVLSLLGTRGERTTWNSRHNSQGHVGIPLASADFIEAIPMMSRLLKELGLNLDWIDSGDTEIVAKTIGTMAGVFYVPDARTAVDHRGRKIIAAQNFVAEYDVRTVFGLGGSYLYAGGSSTFLTNIVFTRETLEKRQVERFIPLVNEFKTATAGLDASGKVFALTRGS